MTFECLSLRNHFVRVLRLMGFLSSGLKWTGKGFFLFVGRLLGSCLSLRVIQEFITISDCYTSPHIFYKESMYNSGTLNLEGEG